jgi:hypothetical protein
VGYWADTSGGVVRISSVGSGNFEGKVVQSRTSGDCPAEVGRVIIKVHGSGTHYTGSDEWWQAPQCDRRFSNTTTIDLSHGNQTAHLCSKDPFPGEPPSNCYDMTRQASFKPPR